MSDSTMNRRDFLRTASLVAVSTHALRGHAAAEPDDAALASESLWSIANKNRHLLTLTGWFTAQDVDNLLSTSTGLESAIAWCKGHGVTKVHLEAFGRGLYADRNTLLNAKSRFLKDGFLVQSGVTTQKFGKQGFTDQPFINSPCYTVVTTQVELQRIFEYVASMFDDIIIDDLYFMDCQCAECIVARGDQSWSKYYCDLMDRLSEERVMKPARAINPKVKIIIKFPQWYDEYHERGYDVPRESRIFDGVWVGTESRNFDYDNSAGYETAYNPYFLMRWLATFSPVSGGWFDSETTTSHTFVEQARHSVLGGANEMILWCYGEMIKETIGGGKIKGTPVTNMNALNQELPGLIRLAAILKDKAVKGIHLLKPGNSDPFEEKWVCSFLGSLGLPLLPAHEIDDDANAALFPVQALKDPRFPVSLQRMLEKGTPVVITDGLAKRLTSHPEILASQHLSVLKVGGSPKSLLKMTREEIMPVRDKLLAPLGIKFDAPSKVELYLFADNYFAIENINDEPIELTIEIPAASSFHKALVLPGSTGTATLTGNSNKVKIMLSARTLIVVESR